MFAAVSGIASGRSAHESDQPPTCGFSQRRATVASREAPLNQPKRAKAVPPSRPHPDRRMLLEQLGLADVAGENVSALVPARF
jgi:hypothetical protein